MRLINKRFIYSLEREKPQRHIGEYFQVIEYKNQFFLYYCCDGAVKVCKSSDLVFEHNNTVVSVSNAPGGAFCVIEDSGYLYMLCGSHVSYPDGTGDIEIPDLVWPTNSRKVIDPEKFRTDRKNGIYVLKSSDGVEWSEYSRRPVMSSLDSSDTCPIGSVAYDTSPCVVKRGEEFFFFGRLNTALDKRELYLTKSKDLLNWSPPQKLVIENEDRSDHNNNYYNPVIYKSKDKYYMLTPYFKACGTENRVCNDGKTILMMSEDLENWSIVSDFHHHDGKYGDRVNSSLVIGDAVEVFYRENVTLNNQKLVCYTLGGFDV